MASSAPSKAALQSQADIADAVDLLSVALHKLRTKREQLVMSAAPPLFRTQDEVVRIANHDRAIARTTRALEMLARVHVHDVDGQMTLF